MQARPARGGGTPVLHCGFAKMPRPRLSPPVVLILLFAAATPAAEAPSVPDPAPAPIFLDVTESSGLDFVHWTGATGDYHFPEITGAGGALLDFDNDGDLDVFLVQGAMLGRGKTPAESILPPAEGALLSDRLFRNDLTQSPAGPVLRFTDVTREAGFAAEAEHGMGAAAGDFDGDGWVDLYVTNAGPNRLWRNRGDGTFEDVTERAGAGDSRWSVPAAFFDAEGDGDLDLYVGNYVDYQPAKNVRCLGNNGLRDYCSPASYPPLPDRLLRNRGDGTFADATAAAGLDKAFGPGLGIAVSDFDGDGRLDLYVANDGAANQLWMQQADGTFRDEALLRGCALNADGKAEAGMGTDAADFDGDGDDDLFITHLDHETNTLYVNDGDGFFHDASIASGLGMASWKQTGFGTGLFDYDNDGRLDVLVTNGAVYSIEAQRRAGELLPFRQPDQLFHNLGPAPAGTPGAAAGAWRFEEVSERAGTAFQRSDVGRGALFGDLDQDGDTDVVLVNNSGAARVLLNQVGAANGWIGLRALVPGRGEAAWRDGLGSRVEVRAGREGTANAAPPVVRRVRTDGSYASSQDPRVLVGLGSYRGPADVLVTWPDGRRERFADLASGRYHTLRQGTGRRDEPEPEPQPGADPPTAPQEPK